MIPSISLLYVDECIVVINKPHGLRSVPGNKAAVPPRSRSGSTTKTDGGTTASKIDRGTTATTASETGATASTNDGLLTARSEDTTIAIPTTTRTLKKRPREQTEASEDPTASVSVAVSSVSGGNVAERRLTAQQAWIAAIESFRQVGSSPLSSSQIPDEEGCYTNNSNSNKNCKNGKKGIVNDDNDCGDTTRVKVKVESKARHWISCIADSHPNQLPSVPRKIRPFIRYCQRNQYKWRRKQQEQHQQQEEKQPQRKSSQNLTTGPVNTDEQLQQHSSQQRNDSGIIENCKFVGGGDDDDDDDESTTEDEMIAREAHSILSTKQRKLMNLPAQTSPEESAYGQVQQYLSTCRTTAPSTASPPLHSPHPSELHVVHRLDCETSGVMVFARTQQVASQLGRYWRNEVVTSFKGGGYLGPAVLPVNEERAVQKSYIALVESWPPLTDDGETSGVIDVPLSPHPTAKLKWNVDFDHGKPSRTVWKISDSTIKISDDTINGMSPITLELKPISGRTHQLRIHCAYMNGKGIIGDSLYSVGCNDLSSSSTKEDKSKPLRLYLHARKLSFPHPSTGKRLEFSCDPSVW